MYNVLIDGDIILNKCCFAAEQRGYLVTENGAVSFYKEKREALLKDPNPKMIRSSLSDHIVKKMIDNLMNQILNDLNTKDYICVVAPADSKTIFRHNLGAKLGYKANRKAENRPIRLDEMREYLLDKYNCVVPVGIETDDELGILQCTEKDTIIASIDKDLLQIPGMHYNITKKEVIESRDPGKLWMKPNKTGKLDLTGTGFKWFCAQMLLGDRVDNIAKPLKGVGSRKVFDMLEVAAGPRAMWSVVKDAYLDSNVDIHINAQLLWILRKRDRATTYEDYINE